MTDGCQDVSKRIDDIFMIIQFPRNKKKELTKAWDNNHVFWKGPFRGDDAEDTTPWDYYTSQKLMHSKYLKLFVSKCKVLSASIHVSSVS